MYRDGLAALANSQAEHGKEALRASAEQGHSRAQSMLGRRYFEEMEALRAQANAHDYQAAAEAERWLTRASEQGELDATRMLVPLLVTRGDLGGALAYLGRWTTGRIVSTFR